MKLRAYLEDIVDEWIKNECTSFPWVVRVCNPEKIRKEFDSFEMLKLYLSTIMYQGEREERSTECIKRLRLDILKSLLFKDSRFEPFLDEYTRCPALAGNSGRDFFFHVMKDPRKWCAKTCRSIQNSTSEEEVCPIFKLKTIYTKRYTSRFWHRILSSFIALCVDLKRYDGSLQELYKDHLRKSKPEELSENLVSYFKGITLPKGVGSDVEKIADLFLLAMSHPFYGIGVWKEISYEDLFPIDVNIDKFCREILRLKGGKAEFRKRLLKSVKALGNDIKLSIKRRESDLVDPFSKLPMEFRESWKNPNCYTRIVEIGILYYYKSRERRPRKVETRRNLLRELGKIKEELTDLKHRVNRIEKELPASNART